MEGTACSSAWRGVPPPCVILHIHIDTTVTVGSHTSCVHVRRASFQKSLVTNITCLFPRKCGFGPSILTEEICLLLTDLNPVIIYSNS